MCIIILLIPILLIIVGKNIPSSRKDGCNMISSLNCEPILRYLRLWLGYSFRVISIVRTSQIIDKFSRQCISVSTKRKDAAWERSGWKKVWSSIRASLFARAEFPYLTAGPGCLLAAFPLEHACLRTKVNFMH